MKEKIKRFIDCNVPTQVCNMKCPYCYVGQVEGFTGKIQTINHSPEEVRNALSKKRMGGTIFINFCGTGETLLGDEILPIVLEVLKEGHYVQIVTNGTISKRFDEIVTWRKELLARLLFKFSYHYTELLRMNLVDVFFENVLKVRDAGCSFSIEITSGDGMVSYIDDMKRICVEKCGAMPHVTVARNNADPSFKLLTEHSREEYENEWGVFESELFDLKMELYSKKRREFCYGGEWTLYLYLANGDLKQCYKGDIIDNIFENPNRPIHFRPIGVGCKEPYCFNGHAWMTLGCIPGMKIPTYCDIRNRVTNTGKEWLTECAKSFLSQKLEDNNIIYDNVSIRPKILMLGDDISKGYREIIRNIMCDKNDIIYPEQTMTCSTHMFFSMQKVAEQLSIGTNIDIVYFNTGLGDVIRISGEDSLVSLGEYKHNLQKIVGRLQLLFPNAKLIFATTTPVKEELSQFDFNICNKDIQLYNEAACRIMFENHIMVHDLNSIVIKHISENKNVYEDFTNLAEEEYDRIAYVIDSFLNETINEIETEREKYLVKVIDDQVGDNLKYFSGKRVVVYGAGDYGIKVVNELEKIGIKPYLVCDQNKSKQGQTLNGTQIISPERYKNELIHKEKDVLLIAIKNPQVVENILKQFEREKDLDIITYRVFSQLRD